MRASTSGALREPPETGDGHDYDAIAFNVWQGRGFGYQWSDENWRKPYEGIPQIPAAAHSTVRVLSHHLSAAGDAVSSFGSLCGHRTKLHRVARRQLRHHGRRRHDGSDHLRAVRRNPCRGDHGRDSSAKPRVDALFRDVHDRAARHAHAGPARVDMGQERERTDGPPGAQSRRASQWEACSRRARFSFSRRRSC